MLGNRAVTFIEMCNGLAGQELDEVQLVEHWKNLKPDTSRTVGEGLSEWMKSNKFQKDPEKTWKETGLPDTFRPQPDDSPTLQEAKLHAINKMWKDVIDARLSEEAAGRDQRLDKIMKDLELDIKAAIKLENKAKEVKIRKIRLQ